MRKSVAPSHGGSLSLRAPIANEDERAVFQGRLALTALIVFVLAFGFWFVQMLSAAILAPAQLVAQVTHRSALIQLATTFAAGGVWLFVRAKQRSIATLDALDPIVFSGLCLGWLLMIWSGPSRGERPEMIVLLASTYTLVVRAAFIPSTAARTAAITISGMAPIVPVTAMMYGGRPPAATPLPPAVSAAIWVGLGIVATGIISHVVHGLRVQVRDAMHLGQYVLEEKIGEGGMGVVYRASHALLRRPAAVKLLSHAGEHATARFEREVRITARLTHPNTVAVFDYGRTPDGTFYYAMEHLEGVTLEDLVDRHGPQPARRVVHVLLQACGALEEAHAAGLVHRDVKPANIMLTERGLLPDVVKVLDFGLVKELAPGGDLGQSSVSAVMGTPHYMAPEAIIDPQSIDGRADLYALGATAYYLLTGEKVFDGSNLVEVCSQHLHRAPDRPSSKRAEIPPIVDEIVLACLAKKAEERPPDAAALAEMLRAAQRETGEWSREEARSWWAVLAEKKSGSVSVAKPTLSDASVLGRTIAVALTDRDRGAA